MEPVETAMVTTVEQNKAKYSKADYMQALLARKIQATIGRPSTREFTRIVKEGLLPHCPVTAEDIAAAEDIFGTDVGVLKGKTTWQAPERARMSGVDVPVEILDRYRTVTLCGDIMFVNKIPFFVSISRNLKFGTAEMIANRQQRTVFNAIEHVCKLYRSRGFKVEFILMDNEFECMRGDIASLGITLNTTAPTVSIEALMMSCVIDAKEERDVATADIPGAFMQADMDEIVYIRLEGVMVDMLMELDSTKYAPHIITQHGKKVLYVQLIKALYGTLRAALLFWRTLSETLTDQGFSINPYDQCVANKLVNGRQCTVLWHADDLKISHADHEVVTSVLNTLSKKFRKDAPMTITRGKIHDYLGMKIDYSDRGKVKITMNEYINDMLNELPRDIDGVAASPASNHLFRTNNKDPTLLSAEEGEMFHHNVAKLLFLCKRVRPDLQLAVAFLTTRVKSPDTDDYKKLARVMRYLRGTVGMPLTLEADGMQTVKWWVDAAFAVHNDMKGHTGGVMSLERGAMYGASKKQKIVSRSSTEAELIGVYDVMSQIMWTRHFLKAQGYGTVDSILHQDNKSAILLEENGKASSSKRIRHINIRYFFVTDHVKGKEVSIRYCPTGDMVSDCFTKPLQGSLFRKMRGQIMNVDPDTVNCWDHRSVLEDKDERTVVDDSDDRRQTHAGSDAGSVEERH
jgi:hypothetical protein